MDDRSFAHYSQQLVSKWGKDEAKYHLLVYHLLDAAAVSLQMWDMALSNGVRAMITGWLGLPADDTRRLLAFWCALHDLGKTSPAFQMKNTRQKSKSEELGFLFDGAKKTDHHSVLGAKLIFEGNLAPREVAIAISGHHGAWNPDFDISIKSVGKGLWESYRAGLVDRLRQLLGVSATLNLHLCGDTRNLFTVWLSGWISVVDWLASNKEKEEYRQDFEPLDAYFQNALMDAGQKLNRLGWVGWRPIGTTVDFSTMFPDKEAYRIQQRVIQETQNSWGDSPFLLILEAMTGIGKTETALLLADDWLQHNGGSGLYVALPTMATSNQMYDRTTKIFKNRYPHDLLSFVLAHGQAAWDERVNNFLVHQVDTAAREGIIVSDWFQSNRKRAMLTPFGVGTVDQSLMAILKTRHFFVRLFGLAGKVIVFDEVHAYDIYMRQLFCNLLGWLRNIGTSVIILSATLPEGFRQDLVQAYCGADQPVTEDESYPRMTLAQPGVPAKVVDLRAEVDERQDREIVLEWETEANLIPILKTRLQEGGCAAVICNTVRHAQEVFESICQAMKAHQLDDLDITLFHARFPQAWRTEKEKAVLGKFGKGSDDKVENPNRPRRAVVVATQVIEQSLDLDFDLMISEFAPIDLLMQRAGRLHRHNRERPPALGKPTLILLQPETLADGSLHFGRSEKKVYPRDVLLTSYLSLRGKTSFKSVTETRERIEQVYGNRPLPPDAAPFAAEIAQLRHEAEDVLIKKKNAALVGMIPDPTDRNLFNMHNLELHEEDDPLLHRAYHAMTRDTEGLSMRVVCLHKRGGLFYLNPECTGEPLDLKKLRPRDTRLPEIFEQSVTIQRNDVVMHLLENTTNPLLQVGNVPALRFVYFMPFENGEYPTPSYRFLLDKALGLRIL